MSETKRSRRIKTLSVQPTYKLSDTLHDGMNYFHEPTLAKFKIRRKKKINTFRSESIIENTPIYQTLRDNKFMLERIKTQMNDLRSSQFNEYLKKSNRYQQLLNINDNKKKRLATLNSKIGAVVRKSAMESNPKQIIYNVFISTIKVQQWKPQSREGHTAVVNSSKQELILIGGHCSLPFSTIHIYSLSLNTWIKQIPSQIARSYHSTVVYKNRFAINFGGMGQYNKSRKVRDCYNTISLIDMLNYTIKPIKIHNEESVQPRRCHSAVLLGKFMLVLGGINSKKQYLNDFIYLDLKQLRWYHKQYKIEGKQLESFLQYGIAKHCCFSTFKHRKSYSFYSSDYDDNQTIYFIGGFNQKEEDNTIFQLLLNKYVPTFKKVDYVGSPPSPVNPIIEKYTNSSQNVIIVSGQMYDREIRLFRTKQKSFTLIGQYLNMQPLGGIGSSLNLFNGEYYLFFGLGEQGYLGEITKFTITQQKKQNQRKAKMSFTKNDFLLARNDLSEDSSDSGQGKFLDL